LGKPKAALPKEVVANAHQRIDAALSAEQNPFVRSGLVNASLDILEDLDDLPARTGLPTMRSHAPAHLTTTRPTWPKRREDGPQGRSTDAA